MPNYCFVCTIVLNNTGADSSRNDIWRSIQRTAFFGEFITKYVLFLLLILYV